MPVNLAGNAAARYVAERQHGLIANRQAIAVGVSQRMIDRHRARGRWVRVAPSVSAIGVRPAGFEAALAAALLWAGPDAAAAGASAAWVWGLERSPGPIEIVVGGGRGPRWGGVVVHRTPQLDRRRELMRRHGVPVTTVARTLLDACARRPRDVATDHVDEAIRLGLTNPTALRRYASALPAAGRPEVVRLLWLADQLETRTDSAFERRALDLIRRFGLPEPEPQATFVHDGRRLRADFAWPRSAVVLECDGFAFHRTRRDLDRDRWRRRAYAALGQHVVWITWDDVRDAAAFAPVAADLVRCISAGEEACTLSHRFGG